MVTYRFSTRSAELSLALRRLLQSGWQWNLIFPKREGHQWLEDIDQWSVVMRRTTVFGILNPDREVLSDRGFLWPSKVRQMCGRNTIGEFGSVCYVRWKIPVAGLYIWKPIYLTIAGLFLAGNPAAAEVFSINDALRQAMLTNPAVGEASANRRATQSELRQTQQVGYCRKFVSKRAMVLEKFDQSAAVISGSALPIPVVGAGSWRDGSQSSVVVRQILFDGFSSIDEVCAGAARVNAAASRVKERTELIALDAAEVVRRR